MPRLVFAVACLRPIVATDNSLSLIDVAETVTIHGVPPPDFTLNRPVSLVALWTRAKTDVDHAFEVRVQVRLPSGEIARRRTIAPAFTMTETPAHRHLLHIGDFPAGEPGQYWIELAIREVGTAKWSTTAHYPIEIIHQRDAAAFA